MTKTARSTSGFSPSPGPSSKPPRPTVETSTPLPPIGRESKYLPPKNKLQHVERAAYTKAETFPYASLDFGTPALERGHSDRRSRHPNREGLKDGVKRRTKLRRLLRSPPSLAHRGLRAD